MPTVEERVERRLTAILAADVAGYSRLMGIDEEGTLAALKGHRRELIDPKIGEHRGRIVKTTGDGLLVEFASVVDAVRCAVEMQRRMAERNIGVPAGQRIEFRVGINVGDIILDEGDIYGDGVNIAARLEALAEPGGICVSRVVRDQVRDKLDFAFEDMGEQQVKNIARPVRVYRVVIGEAPSPAAPSGEGAVPQPALALPDKPSIAVLPFQNMSGDPEQEYFVDGMVEEIITTLSRIRWLFVIARNSSFTYKGQAFDVKQVGRELGVRYVLEGSVRKGGNRVRITAQLIDAMTGTHLWADRFDGSLEDVFELQDRVALSVAGVIEPVLQAAEMRRSAARPTTDLTAYDLYLRALAAFSITEERLATALGLLEQAIAIDPRYGPALAWAAICHLYLGMNGWVGEPETNRRKAGDFARQALDAVENDSGILANAAFVLAHLDEDISTMIGLVDRAIALNPSFARGWHVSAVLRILAGQPDLAIEHLETSLRLSPRDRKGQPLTVMARPISSNAGLTTRRRGCCWPSKTIQALPPNTAFSPRAMPIWADWMKRTQWSQSCAPLALCWCLEGCLSATPMTASCTCRACTWPRARRVDRIDLAESRALSASKPVARTHDGEKMTGFYRPPLGGFEENPFSRDAEDRLIRREYWHGLSDRSLVMLMTKGIGTRLTADEKRAHLKDIRREHLADEILAPEILPPGL